MAEERIDIKVTDSGSDKAAKGLRSIASEATKAQSAVDALSKTLSSIPTSKVNALSDVMARNAEMSARVVAAEQRAAAAIQRTREATERANKAQYEAVAAKMKVEAATAEALAAEQRMYTEAVKAETARKRQAEAELSLASARNKADTAAADALAAEQRMYTTTVTNKTAKVNLERAEVALASARNRSAAAAKVEAAATQIVTNATNLNAAASVRATKNSKAMTQATLNLSRQFADVGVTAAMGMSPLMILIQQGPQIADAFQMAKTQGLGFTTVLRGMFGQVAKLAAALSPLVVVAGAVGAAFYGMHKKMSESYPKDVTEGMGLTEEQLKKVENRAVTFGDTVAGVMQTLGEDIRNGPLGTFAAHFAKESEKAAIALFENFRWGVAGAIAFTRAGMKTVDDAFRNAASNMARTMPGAYNIVASAFTKFINHQLNGVRLLVKALNMIPGIDIPEPEFKMPSAENMARAGAESGKTFAEYFEEEVMSEIESQNDFIARSTQNAIENARKRIRKQAGDSKEGRTRTGRKGLSEEEKREEALRRINAQLDNEISRLGMLRKEREVQQRFDQIEEQLLRQRITLTEQETAAIREKLETIQKETEIQSAMDRIYDDLNKTTNEYNATLEAAERLLDAGRISYEQYAQAVTKAKNAHDEAIDPLYRMGLEHDAAMRAARAYGEQAQRVTYYEQIRNQLMREGIVLSAQYVAGENAKVDALMRENDALMRQQQINSTISSIVDPLKEKEMMLANEQYYYDELKRLREEDYLSEEQYAQAKAQLEYKYKEMRLSNYSDMFGKLASLSSSGNRELAAIGKAAAVTQATIDGYLAVQKALASAPPPMNYINAAATGVATAAQIAGIMSTNVGNFATGGQVMVGGRDGVDKNNINMNVTKGERVTIETPAQQKATDEAIARGQAAGGGDVKVSNINVVDPRFVIDSMDTAAGSRVITNIITANKREINAILGSR